MASIFHTLLVGTVWADVKDITWLNSKAVPLTENYIIETDFALVPKSNVCPDFNQ